MQIFIKLPTNKVLTLDVEPSDMVKDIKLKIQERTGILPNRQVLIHEGKFLADEKKLSDYSIQKDSTFSLFVVPALFPPFDDAFYYTIVSGDTLWSIAKRNNINVEVLMIINNLTSTLIHPGQRLLIPVYTTNPVPEFTTYTIVKGDTLWAIAREFGTTVDFLMGINNLTTTLIHPEQQIFVPVIITTERPTLRFSDRGSAVTELQTLLTNLGYNPGPIDGVFGEQTLNAVKKFQSNNGLEVTGIVDYLTWEALLSAEITPPVECDCEKLEKRLTIIETQVIKITDKLNEMSGSSGISNVTKLWSNTPELSGLGTAVVKYGSVYNFWGIGMLKHQQTLRNGTTYYLLRSNQYPDLSLYQENKTIDTLWIETPAGDLYTLPIRFDETGFHFRPTQQLTNLPSGTKFMFTKTLILANTGKE